MSDKTFVLDTNVIINNPLCFNKFDGNDVVIPLVVLEEIDGFKKGEGSRSANARTASRFLDDLRKVGSLHKGVVMEGGGTLCVWPESPDVTFTKTANSQQNDNILLQSVIDNANKYENLILVTEDINLRIRADVFDVPAEGYQNSRAEDLSFYSEVHKFIIPDARMDKLNKDKVIKVFETPEIAETCYQNECVVLSGASTGSPTLARVGSYDLSKVRTDREIYSIRGLNKEQHFALDLLMDPEVSLVVIPGPAGCGKTLLSLAAGLQQTVESGNKYRRMLISRPVVPMGKDIGFLPGELEDKLDPWMAPIYDNMDHLHNGPKTGKEALEYYKMDGTLEIGALNFIRGRSFTDTYVLIDEVQNLSPHEVKTIVTRAGKGTKIVMTGDPDQIDNPYLDHYSNGISYLIDRMRGQEMFGHVTLLKGERSPLAETAAKIL